MEWTQEEKAWLKENYSILPIKQIYAHLAPKTKNQIKGQACRLGVKAARYWTQDQLDFLNEHYGVLSDDEICSRLKKSKNALHIQAVRKLKICHKTNFYTSREVALLLGVSCSKTIIGWMKKGWINGDKSTTRCGPNIMWNFSYEAIEQMLRERPWLVDCSKMEMSYFRSIVKEEFAKNPWYSIRKACQMIGIQYQSSAMAFYLKKKWLHPVKKPIEGGNHWTWLFFKSDIDNFLANDPRRLRPLQSSSTRQRNNLKEGKPVQVYAVWKMKCPKCKSTIRINCNPRLKSDEIKELFIARYVNGSCSHKYICTIAKPLKPYKIRKVRV